MNVNILDRLSGKVYGYMRVSTKDQNEARQVDAMLEYGVPRDNLFLDKQSGKDFDRPSYQKLVEKLQPGDTLVIKSIDRLGRDYDEILAQWSYLTREKQIGIAVLDMHILDTSQRNCLIERLIAEIMLHVLCYVAEQERTFILQRQKEGIAAAKARGVRFGPPERQIPEDFIVFREQWERGAISATKAARFLGVSRNTFLKWARRETYEQSVIM